MNVPKNYYSGLMFIANVLPEPIGQLSSPASVFRNSLDIAGLRYAYTHKTCLLVCACMCKFLLHADANKGEVHQRRGWRVEREV